MAVIPKKILKTGNPNAPSFTVCLPKDWVEKNISGENYIGLEVLSDKLILKPLDVNKKAESILEKIKVTKPKRIIPKEPELSTKEIKRNMRRQRIEAMGLTFNPFYKMDDIGECFEDTLFAFNQQKREKERKII